MSAADLPAPDAIDAFLEDQLLAPDTDLDRTLRLSADAGLVPHAVSGLQGAFLHIVARAIRAQRILEIGTLGGYSALWLARALPADGALISLEADPLCVQAAREALTAAGVQDRVTIRPGPALASLDIMIAEPVAAFDLVFIDADKPNNPAYLERVMALSRPGTVIIGDNVIRGGTVAAPGDDPKARGVHAFIDALGRHPRLTATALQTVGAKGHDGFAMALVT